MASWSSALNRSFLWGSDEHRTSINERFCCLIFHITRGVASLRQNLPVVDVHGRRRGLVNEDDFCRFRDHRLVKYSLLGNSGDVAVMN